MSNATNIMTTSTRRRCRRQDRTFRSWLGWDRLRSCTMPAHSVVLGWARPGWAGLGRVTFMYNACSLHRSGLGRAELGRLRRVDWAGLGWSRLARLALNVLLSCKIPVHFTMQPQHFLLAGVIKTLPSLLPAALFQPRKTSARREKIVEMRRERREEGGERKQLAPQRRQQRGEMRQESRRSKGKGWEKNTAGTW